MTSKPRTPAPVEMKVVAMIARGDPYDNIMETVKKEFNFDISRPTITVIKRRNEVALQTISQAIAEREKDDALGLVERSRRLMGKKLREAEKDGATIRVSDLVAISKEMFHQARVEQNPGEDGSNPTNPKEKLKELQTLLDENDEVRLERIVFAKREQSTTALSHDTETVRGGRSEDGVHSQLLDLQPDDNTDGQEVPPPKEVETPGH